MRAFLFILLAVIVAGAAFALVKAGAPSGRDSPASASRQEVAPANGAHPEDALPASQAGAREPHPARARAIEPAIVATPPVDPEGLERVAPRAPLAELALALPPKRPEVLRLHRPVAPAAGRIEADGFTVTLAGIEVVAPDETCTDEEGRTWPCGMRARTAFRSFLRGRAVECRIAPEIAPGDVTAACALAGRDLATWLAENGWARRAQGALAKPLDAAREGGKGLYGPSPAALR